MDTEDEKEECPLFRRFGIPQEQPIYMASLWGVMLGREVALRNVISWEALKFRRRFRVPFVFFEDLAKEVEGQGWLGCRIADGTERPGIPVNLKWRCTICHLRPSVTQAQARWSKRVEIVRKDVECFFGIVRGHFRILKLSLLYSDRKKIGNIFFACLHIAKYASFI
ncbi:unnamed protein product [Choristocarpus tenellus]